MDKEWHNGVETTELSLPKKQRATRVLRPHLNSAELFGDTRELVIDHAGAVAVQTSSGWSRLDQVALKGVQKWRFVPAKRGGQAVNASVIVPVRFSIEG